MTENHAVEQFLAYLLADDDEHRAVERELHDGVQQQLAAVAVELQLARRLVEDGDAAAASALDAIRSELGRAVDGLRAVAERIHPPLLESQGLASALRLAAASARAPVTLETAIDAPLPPAVALTAYRVVVAAFTAGCTRATASTRTGELELEIAPGTADSGALEALCVRAATLGGRLEISAERVLLTLPLRS
jgi:signal transduction histidine kinase